MRCYVSLYLSYNPMITDARVENIQVDEYKNTWINMTHCDVLQRAHELTGIYVAHFRFECTRVIIDIHNQLSMIYEFITTKCTLGD